MACKKAKTEAAAGATVSLVGDELVQCALGHDMKRTAMVAAPGAAMKVALEESAMTYQVEMSMATAAKDRAWALHGLCVYAMERDGNCFFNWLHFKGCDGSPEACRAGVLSTLRSSWGRCVLEDLGESKKAMIKGMAADGVFAEQKWRRYALLRSSMVTRKLWAPLRRSTAQSAQGLCLALRCSMV